MQSRICSLQPILGYFDCNLKVFGIENADVREREREMTAGVARWGDVGRFWPKLQMQNKKTTKSDNREYMVRTLTKKQASNERGYRNRTRRLLVFAPPAFGLAARSKAEFLFKNQKRFAGNPFSLRGHYSCARIIQACWMPS